MQCMDLSKNGPETKQAASTMSLDNHCDPSASFSLNGLENTELNPNTNTAFHTRGSFLPIGGEKVSDFNQNNCFNEFFGWNNSQEGIFSKKGGGGACSTSTSTINNLYLPHSLHLANQHFDPEISMESGVVNFQHQLRNTVGQDGKVLLSATSPFKGIAVFCAKEPNELSKLDQLNQPCPSKLSEKLWETQKNGYSSNGAIIFDKQCNDKTTKSKRTTSVRVSEDPSEQSNVEQSEHHTVQPQYSSEPEHLPSVSLPAAVKTCDFQMNPFMLLPVASSPLQSQVVHQNSMSMAHSVLKANANDNYSCTSAPLNEYPVFFLNRVLPSKPCVQQFSSVVPQNSNGQTRAQDRLPSTQQAENCVQSLSSDKNSNRSRDARSQNPFSVTSVQSSLPLGNATIAQQNCVFPRSHPQALFLSPNPSNHAMVTMVDRSNSLMFNTPPMPGAFYYTNFNEVPQHLRHSEAIESRLPYDYLSLRSNFFENGAQNRPFASTSPKFTPLSPHVAPSVSLSIYPFLSSATLPLDRNMNISYLEMMAAEGGCSNQQTPAIPLVDTSHLQFLANNHLNAQPARKCTNVHSKMAGVALYIPYAENPTTPLTSSVSTSTHPSSAPADSLAPTSNMTGLLNDRALRGLASELSPPQNGDVTTAHFSFETLPIFFQMFPCEIRDRKAIINRVIAAVCGTDVATVLSIEPRSETSFIASVRTCMGGNLFLHKLRCRVLMDRLGFWYAETIEQYKFMKEYCETIRRLPQQNRHIHTEGLPCMPLVVEFSRLLGRECAPSDKAPPCFDEVIPMATVDRHRSHHATRMNSNTANNRHPIGLDTGICHSSFTAE